MDFRQFDYFFKKRLGYFGFRYMRYLQDHKPAAYERLASSMEAAHILETINAHCQFEMETLMLSLKAGKDHMNPRLGFWFATEKRTNNNCWFIKTVCDGLEI